MTIDTTQILITIIQVVGSIITAMVPIFAVLLYKKIANFLHIKVEAHDQDVLTQAIDRGISLVEQTAEDQAKVEGKLKVNDANVGKVLEYVTPKVQDALTRLNVSDKPEVLGQRIAAQIASRLTK